MSNVRLAPCRALMGLLVLGLALIAGLNPALAQDRSSPPAELSRFVSITRSLEAAPLGPNAQADRQWALAWLTEAPDVSVTVCMTSLGDMEQSYAYAGEIVLQYAFAMAVLVIEHPEMSSDLDAQQVAGVTGALRAYRAILGSRPDARSPALDALMEIENRGGLPEFIRSMASNCSA